MTKNITRRSQPPYPRTQIQAFASHVFSRYPEATAFSYRYSGTGLWQDVTLCEPGRAARTVTIHGIGVS